MTRTTELTHLLKNLKLGAMAATLPERIALARREQLDYASFLEIILSDEVNRRAHRRTELQLHNAGFEETCRLEDFDWSASITMDRRLLDAVFSLEFLDKARARAPGGTGGVGKSFLAQALGYSAIHAGHTVRFSHADDFSKAVAQARVDNSTDRTFRSFLSPDLLILDDLGLHGLTAQQSADLYKLILNRHRSSSFVITSNRAVYEWLSLFDDPILGNSALDAWTTPATKSSSRAPDTASDSRRRSFSSLARIFFGWAATPLTTRPFLCRCHSLEHRPSMPLQIPGSWTPVRTVWNYRQDQSLVLVQQFLHTAPYG